MIFSSVKQVVIDYFNHFDFRTLEDTKNDPYVFIALVSETGQLETFSNFLAKADNYNNHHLFQGRWNSAIKATNRILDRIPFCGVMQTKGKHYCVCCQIGDQYLTVAVIASNESDAEYVCKSIARLFVSF